MVRWQCRLSGYDGTREAIRKKKLDAFEGWERVGWRMGNLWIGKGMVGEREGGKEGERGEDSKISEE